MRIGAGVLGAALAAVVVAVAAPVGLVSASLRVAVAAVLASGAWLSLRRTGLVDLGTAGAAAAGAYATVATALAGLPTALGLPAGAVAGAAVGAAVGATGGRVGRTLTALTSLAVGLAVVAVLGAVPVWGGAAGFHAVPLLTPSERGDLVVLLLIAVAAVMAVTRVARSHVGAAGSVAARAPHVAATLGRWPVVDAAVAGAAAGAVLGVGGAAGAAATGSVVPGGYGLSLAAALALAALVGGERPLAGTVGAAVVFAPAVLWPTVAVVSEAPLLVTGVAGMALLAWRPGGLLTGGTGDEPVPEGPSDVPPRPRSSPLPLTVCDAPVPGGRVVSFEVQAGQIVALAGRNGSGKSTLLARIGGQLPHHGSVRLAGVAPARSVTGRARRGVARTWQHPPRLPQHDALTVVGGADAAAARWARAVLGDSADTPAGADLVRLAAARPSLALVDEPAAHVPSQRVATLLRGLADGGAAVVVAEHRPEVLAAADRTVHLGEDPIR
ncbi:MAG: ATP-binding cassette domain-containing protein [Actinobacteria bacterium]|nr:ATP-binding cassette domain-containing protein [Actinomycetota bacterium]